MRRCHGTAPAAHARVLRRGDTCRGDRGDGPHAAAHGKGAGFGGEHNYSEATARTIDEEVRAILDRTHDRVCGVLTTKKAVLIAAARELKRIETLEGDALRRALAGEGVTEETRP